MTEQLTAGVTAESLAEKLCEERFVMILRESSTPRYAYVEAFVYRGGNHGYEHYDEAHPWDVCYQYLQLNLDTDCGRNTADFIADAMRTLGLGDYAAPTDNDSAERLLLAYEALPKADKIRIWRLLLEDTAHFQLCNEGDMFSECSLSAQQLCKHLVHTLQTDSDAEVYIAEGDIGDLYALSEPLMREYLSRHPAFYADTWGLTYGIPFLMRRMPDDE